MIVSKEATELWKRTIAELRKGITVEERTNKKVIKLEKMLDSVSDLVEKIVEETP